MTSSSSFNERLSERGTVAGRRPHQHADYQRSPAPPRARASTSSPTLDKPQPQVEIEARIVQTTSDFARTIWCAVGVPNGRVSPELGKASPVVFPFPSSGDTRPLNPHCTPMVRANSLVV